MSKCHNIIIAIICILYSSTLRDLIYVRHVIFLLDTNLLNDHESTEFHYFRGNCFRLATKSDVLALMKDHKNPILVEMSCNITKSEEYTVNNNKK